jgi:glycosyltransferase involved in cell wall biosynthesis
VRLLAATNLYPPYGYGYGAICADVMEALAERGHDCTVLCARGGPGRRVSVREGLGHVPGAWRRPVAGLRAEVASQRLVRAAIGAGADAALVWHMRGIGKGSLTLLHDAGIPVIYMLGDLWAVYERPGPPAAWRVWQRLDRLRAYRAARAAAGRIAGLGRLELRPPPIATGGIVCFASDWLRQRYAGAGFRPRRAQVVHNGVRLEEFAGPRTAPGTPPLPVLFAGRLDATKGADLAVGAIARTEAVALTMAGGGDPADLAAIRALIEHLGVADRVRLAGELPRDEVAALMRASEVLAMPGRVEEAFGLVYVEAMAAGAVAVGTATGGAAEICRDGENSLVVGADAEELAGALARLRDDAALRERLRAAGAETAAGFSLDAMVGRIEALL